MKKLLLIISLFVLISCEKSEVQPESITLVNQTGLEFILCEVTIDGKFTNFTTEQFNQGYTVKTSQPEFKLRLVDINSKTYNGTIYVSDDCRVIVKLAPDKVFLWINYEY